MMMRLVSEYVCVCVFRLINQLICDLFLIFIAFFVFFVVLLSMMFFVVDGV